MPLTDDKEFLSATPNEQAKYLQETDPDFKAASAADQAAYLAHLTNQPLQEQPKQGVLGAAKESLSKLNPFGSSTPQPIGNIDADTRQMYQQRKSEHGMPYALGAGVADALGADVSGMEQSAKAGDPGGVIGHAIPGVATAMAPLALEGAGRGMRALNETPVGQAVRTAGRAIENADLTKPFKSVSQIGRYWGEEAPGNKLLAPTQQAVRERRAAMIPLRSRGSAGMNPMTEGGKIPINPEQTFLPEPREEFPGEQPGMMGSVPREELSDLALRRKPGAGQQMQQLGKPVIYIPRGSDLP